MLERLSRISAAAIVIAGTSVALAGSALAVGPAQGPPSACSLLTQADLSTVFGVSGVQFRSLSGQPSGKAPAWSTCVVTANGGWRMSEGIDFFANAGAARVYIDRLVSAGRYQIVKGVGDELAVDKGELWSLAGPDVVWAWESPAKAQPPTRSAQQVALAKKLIGRLGQSPPATPDGLAPGATTTTVAVGDRGDEGQFACSLISGADVTATLGLRTVQRAPNGGNFAYGGRPGYSNCLLTASGGWALQMTVAIYSSDGAAAQAFARAAEGGRTARLGDGSLIEASSGPGIDSSSDLLHGHNLVTLGVTGAAGAPPTVAGMLALAERIDGHFARPVSQPAPPEPGPGDIAPCATPTAVLATFVGSTVTPTPAFTGIEGTLECDFEIAGAGTYYLDTTTTAGWSERGGRGSLSQLVDRQLRAFRPPPGAPFQPPPPLSEGPDTSYAGPDGYVIDLTVPNQHGNPVRVVVIGEESTPLAAWTLQKEQLKQRLAQVRNQVRKTVQDLDDELARRYEAWQKKYPRFDETDLEKFVAENTDRYIKDFNNALNPLNEQKAALQFQINTIMSLEALAALASSQFSSIR